MIRESVSDVDCFSVRITPDLVGCTVNDASPKRSFSRKSFNLSLEQNDIHFNNQESFGVSGDVSSQMNVHYTMSGNSSQHTPIPAARDTYKVSSNEEETNTINRVSEDSQEELTEGFKNPTAKQRKNTSPMKHHHNLPPPSQESVVQESASYSSNSDSKYESGSSSSSSAMISTAFKFTSLGQHEELKLLCFEQQIMYTQIENEQGNSLIVKAIQNKDAISVKHLIINAKEQLRLIFHQSEAQIDANILEWLNKKSKSGHTAAHFGCYSGVPEILIMLLNLRADFSLTNNEGSCGMHIAAQSDAIASIVFLLLLGMDADVKDNKQATPLHWASFQGFDQSVAFLLAFNAAVNEQDFQGMTALILSVMNGSMKIVKALLLAGADKNLTDSKGRTALQLISEEEEFMNEDINEMLRRTSGYQEYCNIRTSFKPTDKSNKQITYFITMYLASHLVLIVCYFNLWGHKEIVINCSVLGVLFIFTAICFLGAWRRDPGYLKASAADKDEIDDMRRQFDEADKCGSGEGGKYGETRERLLKLFLLLKKEVDPIKICAKCCIVKPKRSRHCDVCKCCVAVYDHHCPWINNCVGTRNHAVFLGFVALVWLSMLIVLVMNGLYLWRTDYEDGRFDVFGIAGQKERQTFLVIKILLGSIVSGLCLVFGVPLTILLFVQLGNFTANRTTFERFTMSQQSMALQNASQTSTLRASFLNDATAATNQGYNLLKYSSFKNCSDMSCNNKDNPKFFAVDPHTNALEH